MATKKTRSRFGFGLLAGLVFVAAVAAARAGQIQHLNSKDRSAVFETVWKDIRDIYYDPQFHGVDWKAAHDRYRPMLDSVTSDADFYALVNRMIGELHDAHTRLNTPEQWENRHKFQGLSTGIQLDEIDGRVVVAGVLPDSPAAAAGVEPGSILARVGGKPIAEALADSAQRTPESSTDRLTRLRIVTGVLAGSAGTAIAVTLQRPDGSSWDVSLTREILPQPPDVHSRRLASGAAYIRFDGFEQHVDTEFSVALADYRAAPGLIIDLRRNGGGRLDIMLSIAGSFFDRETLFTRMMNRQQITSAEKSAAQKQQDVRVGRNDVAVGFSGPVVVLTSTRTASASELLAGGLQELGRAKIIGTQTCGCVVGIASEQHMKGGGVLEISQLLWFTPAGRKLEGDGVIPDRIVAPTITDLQQHRDVALDAAENLLRQMTRTVATVVPGSASVVLK